MTALVDGPEWSHRVPIDRIGTQPLPVAAEADEGARAALAARFGVPQIVALAMTGTVQRTGGAIALRGRVHGRVVQEDAVTGEALPPASVEAPLDLRFVDPAGLARAEDEELELSADDCDTLPHDGQAVDVGEAAAQEWALALEPFPRAAGSADGEEERRWRFGPDAGAFAGLKALLERDGS